MSSKVFLYRRKGNTEWATCDRSRFVEISSHNMFETKVLREEPIEIELPTVCASDSPHELKREIIEILEASGIRVKK